MRPERSGVPRPESISPCANGSGGKVTGMRITRTCLPASPSTFQKVSPCRRLMADRPLLRAAAVCRDPEPPAPAAPTTTADGHRAAASRDAEQLEQRRSSEQRQHAAAARGRRPPALRAPKRNGSVRLVEGGEARAGRSAVSRFRKSKIACRPGLRPVEKVDQETGVCDGIVERSGEKVPCVAQLREVRELALVHPLRGRAWRRRRRSRGRPSSAAAWRRRRDGLCCRARRAGRAARSGRGGA